MRSDTLSKLWQPHPRSRPALLDQQGVENCNGGHCFDNGESSLKPSQHTFSHKIVMVGKGDVGVGTDDQGCTYLGTTHGS